jgi:hypothetical protein
LLRQAAEPSGRSFKSKELLQTILLFQVIRGEAVMFRSSKCDDTFKEFVVGEVEPFLRRKTEEKRFI